MTSRYRADIDGLRSIAILSVVFFHAGVSCLKGGYVGVDVFFVISGYLIGSHVYRDVQANRFSFLNFYTRRAKRILPAFFAVVAFTLVLGLLILAPQELRKLGQQGVAALASASNIFFWKKTGYFQAASETQPLLMTWSLGVEEQFYVFFPWLIVALRRARPQVHVPLLMVLTVALFALALFGMHRDVNAAFYLLPFRAWELGVGCLLGITEIRVGEQSWREWGSRWGNAMSLLGVAMVMLPVVLYWQSISFPGWTALPPVLGTALLIASPGSLLNRKLLSATPLVWIGRVSYSWYLWHWPLMSFLRVSAPRGWNTGVGIGAALVSLALGAISYYAIETPFRKTSATGGGVLVRYALGSAALVALCALPVLTRGLPSRYPVASRVEAAAHDRLPDPCIVSYGETQFNASGKCVPPADGTPTLALLGDSHASALAPYLRDMAESHGWHFAELTKSSCPPLSGTTRAMHLHPAHARECKQYNEEALAWILRHPQVKSIVLGGYWLGPFGESPVVDAYTEDVHRERIDEASSVAQFRSGLRREIEELKHSGRTVLVAQDVPHLAFDPVLMELSSTVPLRRNIAHLLTAPSALQTDTVARAEAFPNGQDKFAEMVRSIAAAEGVDVLETPNAFCAESTCSYGRDGYSFYFDPQHLSALGSQVALRDAPADLWQDSPMTR